MKKMLFTILLAVSLPAMATMKPKPPQKPLINMGQNQAQTVNNRVSGGESNSVSNSDSNSVSDSHSDSASTSTSDSRSSANNSISEGAIQSDVTVNNAGPEVNVNNEGLDLSINDAGSRIDNRYSTQYKSVNRVQHVAPRSASNCIGTVCRATNAVIVTGQYDDVTGGSSINLGVVFPFGGGSKATDRAMNLEADRLYDRNRQMKERHQGEMAQMCMILHEQMSLTPEDSPELWGRCFAYTPFTNHTHKVARTRPHVADGNLKRQASPHSENRH